jgi:membrane-bound lytic murein transglycosylase D
MKKSNFIGITLLLGMAFCQTNWAQVKEKKFDYGDSQILIDEQGEGIEGSDESKDATEQPMSNPATKPASTPTVSPSVTRTITASMPPDVEGKDDLGFYKTLPTPVDVIKKHKLISPTQDNYPLKAALKRSNDDGGKYQERLLRLQSTIPLDYNEMVGNFIKMYINNKPAQVREMLTRADMYNATIEAALDRYQLPRDLKYLPVILSALIPSSQSEEGGSGLWQLSYKTGLLYGLESNDLIDERRDPLLSSEAAARHLKNLYKKYKDWHLVIAAFCAGEGTLNKAIQRSGKYRYWDAAPYMPLESQAYVPLFIAAAYVMNNYEAHNLYKAEISYANYLTDTLRVQVEISLKAAAAHLNMSYEDLKFLNPAVKTDIIPPSKRGFPLTVPNSKVGLLSSYVQTISSAYSDRIIGQLNNNLSLPNSNPLNKDLNEYGKAYNPKTDKKEEVILKPSPDNPNQEVALKWIVTPDDELQYVAMAVGKTPDKLMEWNNLSSETLTAGQLLTIYTPKKDEPAIRKVVEEHNATAKTAISVSSASKSKPKTAKYTVKNGDTLSSIADKFNISSDLIKRYNGLKKNDLLIGQKLIIPLK